MMCNNIFFAEMEMEFCSASAIIFLFANDFIERLICFVFALSMKLRSSLTCCDERISILSRAEWEFCSNLGGRLFRLNSHTVYNKYKCCRRRLTPFKSCRHATHRVEEQASKKITPKKEVKRTNGSGSNMVGLLKRKKSFKENFSKNSCTKAIYDFLK